jgi:hypothetical protein
LNCYELVVSNINIGNIVVEIVFVVVVVEVVEVVGVVVVEVVVDFLNIKSS